MYRTFIEYARIVQIQQNEVQLITTRRDTSDNFQNSQHVLEFENRKIENLSVKRELENLNEKSISERIVHNPFIYRYYELKFENSIATSIRYYRFGGWCFVPLKVGVLS